MQEIAREILFYIPQGVLVLPAALLAERLIALPMQYHPLNFFRALALGISAKVHPANRKSAATQHKIAGTLAIPTLLLPFLFLGYMMLQVAEFPALFDFVMLWLCLSYGPAKNAVKAMLKALGKKQKSLAKARLAPYVLRKTDNLSEMGLCKAAIEMVALRSAKEYFAVIFYFLCLGSFAALGYRLLIVLNQCWNPKSAHFKHFGKPAQALCTLLEILPNRLLTLTLMVLGSFRGSFKVIGKAHRWGNDNSRFILGTTAASLNASLGGPVYYNEQKIRRPVLAGPQAKDPDPQAVRKALSLVEKALAMWLFFITLFTALYVVFKV